MTRIVALATAVALALVGLVAAPAQAADTITLTGTIYIGDTRYPAKTGEVQVSLAPHNGAYPVTHTTTTDAQGRFTLTDVPKYMNYRLRVHDTRGREVDTVEDYSAWLVDSVYDVTLGADGVAEGQMYTWDTHQPTPGTAILVGTAPDGQRLRFHAVTGPTAEYEFEKLPRSPDLQWTLSFFPSSQLYAETVWDSTNVFGTPTYLTGADFEPGIRRDGEIYRSAVVAGTVSGIPASELASQRVRIQVLLPNGSGGWREYGGMQFVYADGSYEFVRMPAGSYRFQVVWPNGGGVARQTGAPVTLAERDVFDIDIAMGQVPHTRDFSGDGRPDALVRGWDKQLMAYKGSHEQRFLGPLNYFSNWGAMTAIVEGGDFTGDGRADVFGRDKAGALWLYPQVATPGKLGPRTKVASGLATATAILSPGDLNGDERSDVLVRDSAGTLWLYRGDGAGHLLPRVRFATGWKGATAILGPGDLNRDGYDDLLARDSRGILWLYRGDGAGHLRARTVVGSGWAGYPVLRTYGDLDEDYFPDLVARDTKNRLWLFRGDGNGGFRPRIAYSDDYMVSVFAT